MKKSFILITGIMLIASNLFASERKIQSSDCKVRVIVDAEVNNWSIDSDSEKSIEAIVNQKLTEKGYVIAKSNADMTFEYTLNMTRVNKAFKRNSSCEEVGELTQDGDILSAGRTFNKKRGSANIECSKNSMLDILPICEIAAKI